MDSREWLGMGFLFILKNRINRGDLEKWSFVTRILNVFVYVFVYMFERVRRNIYVKNACDMGMLYT